MLYLPLHHSADCVAMIEELGSKPGIAGCVIASPRYEKVQAKGMMQRLLGHGGARHGAGFHGMANWEEPALPPINEWGAVQAIGMPQSNMTHMTNWLMSGMPERFPS